MEIKDYEKKLNFTMDFYEQAVEVNQMVHDSIRGFHYLYGYDFYNEREVSNPEKEALIERRRRQLLVELGRVGEYAIKYLILMQQIHEYPKQSIEDFKNKRLYNIGEKGVRNTYRDQYHMSTDIIDTILEAKEKHSMQPGHDYSYLFTILETLYPNIVKNIQENILYNIKGYNYSQKDISTRDISALISFFASIQMLEASKLSEEDSKEYIKEYKEIMEKSGDAFVKLRYLENNAENKQYNMDEVIYLLDQLIDFIELIHEYNKDYPDKDIKGAYIKKKINEYVMPKGLHKYDEYPALGENLDKAKQLCSTTSKVLDEYPQVLDSIDYSQLAIWKKLKKQEIDFDETISNFITNLSSFKDDETILQNRFPLLLPKEHIIETKGFLEEIGIEINSINEKDTSILCVPIEYLRKGYELIKDSDITVERLINGVNQVIYDDGMQSSSTPGVPLRHR